MNTNSFARFAPTVLALIAGLCGCSQKAPVIQYQHPTFCDTSVKTIAVLPFRVSTDSPYSGTEFAQMVADALKKTGRYNKVYGPAELPFTPPEQYPLSVSTQPSEDQMSRLVEMPDVQAYVTGSADFYAGRMNQRRLHWPRYPERSDSLYLGTYYGVDPYYERDYTQEVVTVAVNLWMISIDDGSTKWQSPAPLVASTAYSDWLARSPTGLYDEPTGRALAMVRAELAPPCPPAPASRPQSCPQAGSSR